MIKKTILNGGGLTEATARLKRQGYEVVESCTKCGAIMSDRKIKKLGCTITGLKEWFKQDWVDIGAKKKGYPVFKKCGRKSASGSKRKYPKCVPCINLE